jgi:hypothetical protein
LRRSSADKSAGSLFRDAAGDKLVNKVLLHFLAVQAIELARPALLGAVNEHAELATDIDQGPLLVVQLELDAPDIARVLAAPVLEVLDNDLLYRGQMIRRISAQAAYVVGGINGTVNTATGYGTYTGVNPIVDPYANVAVPSSSTTCSGWTPNGNSGLHLSSGNSATLKPGSAGGTCAVPHDVQLDAGATLNLCPGIYVFNSGSNLTMNGSSVLNAPPTASTTPVMSSTLCPGDTSGGVTIVFTNSGSSNPGAPNIGGQATVNLTAPTTGSTSGIALFQARTTCSGNGNGNNGCNASLGRNAEHHGCDLFPEQRRVVLGRWCDGIAMHSADRGYHHVHWQLDIQ